MRLYCLSVLWCFLFFFATVFVLYDYFLLCVQYFVCRNGCSKVLYKVELIGLCLSNTVLYCILQSSSDVLVKCTIAHVQVKMLSDMIAKLPPPDMDIKTGGSCSLICIPQTQY